MKAKITKRIVDAAESDSKDFCIWDTEIKGFGLKVTPKGRKVYLAQYRVKGTARLRKYTIGAHGSPWTPDKAREEAKSILGLVADGEDPAEKKAIEGVTVLCFCGTYLEEMEGRKKPASLLDDKRYIDRFIIPAFGNRSVADIGGYNT